MTLSSNGKQKPQHSKECRRRSTVEWYCTLYLSSSLSSPHTTVDYLEVYPPNLLIPPLPSSVQCQLLIPPLKFHSSLKKLLAGKLIPPQLRSDQCQKVIPPGVYFEVVHCRQYPPTSPKMVVTHHPPWVSTHPEVNITPHTYPQLCWMSDGGVCTQVLILQGQPKLQKVVFRENLDIYLPTQYPLCMTANHTSSQNISGYLPNLTLNNHWVRSGFLTKGD